ncbi:membrane hypothetical protein [Candidatus Zixiibacteriota bacterium]|nr:membrane hypothetical protein [candidate division Zixibacteria bacterium]
MTEWRRIEPYFNIFGLFVILVFPIAVTIPVLGYFIETAALAYVILFALQRRQLFLTVGSIGSVIVASLLFGPSPMLLGLWALVIIPGTIFGKLVLYGISPGRTFVAAMIISGIISLFIFASERKLLMDSMDEMQKWVQATLMSDSGSVDEKADMTSWATNLISIIKRLMPALMALSAAAQLFVAAVAVIFLLRGIGQFAPSFGNFLFWKMSFNFIYPAGLFIVMRLAGNDLMKIVADNFLVFMGVIYAVFGFSVIEYFLRRIKASLFLKIIFYAGFVFLQLPGLVFAAALGVFDSYFDFRRVKAKMIG